MSVLLRAELFRLRSTWTVSGLFGAMLALVLFAVLLHGFLLDAGNFDTASKQLAAVFAWGGVVGGLFTALLGAMSFTGEIRHGTIRPTFLVTPQRRQVVMAKIWASMVVGAGFGFAAGAVAAGVGAAALKARGIDLRLDAGDYMLLVAGGAAAAAMLAAIGVGLGAIVRNQVSALVGICAWLLFVENLLVGDLGIAGDIGRILPGAAAKAVSGQDQGSLTTPVGGLLLLALYAATAAVVGCVATDRRDVD